MWAVPQDVGPEVKNFKRGDRVVSSFDMGCGHCFYCNRGLFTGCATTNPSELQAKMYGQATAGFHGALRPLSTHISPGALCCHTRECQPSCPTCASHRDWT